MAPWGAVRFGPVDLSGAYSVVAAHSLDNGSITIGGQTFRGFASAEFNVTADPFVIGNDTPRGDNRFSTPFTMQGFVQVFSDLDTKQVLFTQPINGSGTLSLLADNASGQFIRPAAVLNFAPAQSPSPTPEPGSLLLLATGCVAAWQSRRLRTQAE